MLSISKRRNIIYLTFALTFVSSLVSIYLLLMYKTLMAKATFNVTDLVLAMIIPISIISLVTYFLLHQIYLINHSKHKAEQLIYIDTLTQVYNRRYFEYFANNIFLKEKNTSIILIDIDDFKQINDQYGHQAGDYVIKKMAKSIQNDLRDSDKVTRIGGDEFAIICTKSQPTSINEIAERIRKSIQNTHFVYMSHEINITVSIGCISSNDDSFANFDELLRSVDGALYQSKDNGKNLVTSINCA